MNHHRNRYDSGPWRTHNQPNKELDFSGTKDFDQMATTSRYKDSMRRRDFLLLAGVSAAAAITGVRYSWADSKAGAKVGFVLPERGKLAREASSLKAGFDLFLKELGDNAPKLEIISLDPGPEESKTLTALAELIMNRQAEFVIGPLSLDASEKATRAVSGSESILFVTNPSVRLVAGELCLHRSFRLTPNTYQATQPLGPWALKNVGSKVFIVGSNKKEDKEMADFFAHGFERSGGQFVDRMEISRVRKESPGVIQAIRKSNADFICACFDGDKAISFLKAINAASPALSQPIIGPESLTEYPHTIKRAGRSGLGIRTMGFVTNPVELADQVRTKLGRTISSASRVAEGYDIAQAICAALKNCSGETQGTVELTKSLEGIEINGSRGKVVFDKNHEPIIEAFVRKWDKNGNKLVSNSVEQLGEIKSLDFGCGRVGFPKRPDDPPTEEDDSGDIE